VGFLLADGCVRKSKWHQHTISLSLAAKDRDHVEKFRSFLGATHPISESTRDGYGKPRTMVRLTVSSDRLADSLAKYNVVPQKTATAVPPAALVMDRDFWRGMVDGDGWLFYTYRRGQRKPETTVGLTGTVATCESFLKWVKSFTPTQTTIRRNGSIYRVAFTSNIAREVVRRLYEGATMGLSRKQHVAASILSLVPVRPFLNRNSATCLAVLPKTQD
jgi:hypothetical protein